MMTDYDFEFVRRPQDASSPERMTLASDEEYQRWITDTPQLTREQATRIGRLLYSGVVELDPLADGDVDIRADGPTGDPERAREAGGEDGPSGVTPSGNVISPREST